KIPHVWRAVTRYIHGPSHDLGPNRMLGCATEARPELLRGPHAMTENVSELRTSAGRVAKWLVEKGRPDDAVALLSAWAVAGPNDSEGQHLLAEALRIDPSARVAQEAFERMEGIPGTHGTLEGALRQFSRQEISRLENEMRRPTFRRAQMGFNNNVKY